MHRRTPPDPGRMPSGRVPGGRLALALVLVIALVCGAVAAVSLWNTGGRTDRELALHRHQVAATTTGPAEAPPASARYGAAPRAVAPAVWQYPENVRRSGSIHVPAGTPPKHTVTIWVDDTGTPARPPGGAADRALTSLLGGSLATAAVGAAGAGLLVLAGRRARTRRFAVWEQEWEQVEPEWSGRLRRPGGPPEGDDE
ncbi:hypothetical protein [Streptomyces sp. NPDC058872]|uniref:Rv1733c family protein n=1 Tax=Streptomyces sp. NPDC058872 TaxID=3346661 RepID=UPI0036C54599